MSRRFSSDARLVLWVCLGIFVIILVGAFLAPAREDNDPTPSTWNSGSHGAKAAYELLAQLGDTTARWDKPAAALNQVNASHTTLILAGSQRMELRKEEAGVSAFLHRGGRVLATGALSALMLPDSQIEAPTRFYTALCYTTPQSLSGLGRAGQVAMAVPIRWKSEAAHSVRIDQACGQDAVVVHYSEGPGEVIWWSSAAPLSNRGLKNDSSLRLLLASVGGPGRTVLFDEYIHGDRESLWQTMSGTPVKALAWQLAAVALLLLVSFGRRSGPLWEPSRPSRTSPLEFAESMGALYQKAGTTEVAVGAAERRLMDFLHNEGGIPRETLRSGPDAIASTVAARFSYSGPELAEDLKAAQETEFNKLSAKGALELVRRLDRHISNLRELMTSVHGK
ncbi:MAG: DUF4350 domain-containing protein [Acidobacteriaceae bacterium]